MTLSRTPPLLLPTPTTASTRSSALEAETVAKDSSVAEADEAATEAVADTEVTTVEDVAEVDHAEELAETVEDLDAPRNPKSQDFERSVRPNDCSCYISFILYLFCITGEMVAAKIA